MKYRLLGRSGLRVSEFCLGTMTFGTEWGWGATKAESRKMFNAFAAAGGNFIDTANFYTGGTSEEYLGEFMAPERERYVLATKYTLTMRPDDPNASGNHRKNMVQSVEASLKRLKTDHIDLLWIHAWDFATPVDEVMRALDDLVRAGKVFYVGISDAPAWIVSQANMMADLRGWTPFTAIQIEYSLAQRTVERDLTPMARALDLAVLAWSPLGGGVLTGKYNPKGKKKAKPGNARYSDGEWAEVALAQRNLAIATAVSEVATEAGVSPAQVAINWLARRPGIVIPILGARKTPQIKDNLKALDFDLSEEHLAILDSASAIERGFPHDFLNMGFVRGVVFGETEAQLVDHRAGRNGR